MFNLKEEMKLIKRLIQERKPKISAHVFIDMIANKLTQEELDRLYWERDGRIYSFREWMFIKYQNYEIAMSEKELERAADKIVREYRSLP